MDNFLNDWNNVYLPTCAYLTLKRLQGMKILSMFLKIEIESIQ